MSSPKSHILAVFSAAAREKLKGRKIDVIVDPKTGAYEPVTAYFNVKDAGKLESYKENFETTDDKVIIFPSYIKRHRHIPGTENLVTHDELQDFVTNYLTGLEWRHTQETALYPPDRDRNRGYRHQGHGGLGTL